MSNVARALTYSIERAAREFPALVVTGPRRAGKTTLLRTSFPKATYVLLEDPDIIERVRADPRLFIDELPTPAILDEIQNAPELLAWIRTRIDAAPRKSGQWLLTGSQEAPLMHGVTESLAGRAAIFQLMPLSISESQKVSLLRGGFPEVVLQRRDAGVWFNSYVLTYLERDVRAVTAIRDLSTFRRFLALLATRTGQILNRADLASSLGTSVPTISQWLSVLEVTGQLMLMPSYFENFGKRIVKSPKIYLTDTGLTCHLLGIDNAAALARSPFHGALFEAFVANELVKHQLNKGRRREVYCFRDQQGLEVDFVVPAAHNTLMLVEAKASRTAIPSMTTPLTRLASAIERQKTELFLVHQPTGALTMSAISKGVRAGGVADLLALLR